MRLFKKRKGTVTIMLYCTLYDSDNVAAEDKKVVTAINDKMHKYCEKMIAYEDSKQPPPTDCGNGFFVQFGHKTLQNITCTWDMDTNDMTMWTSGVGHFSWKGKLDQFLASNNLIGITNKEHQHG